MPTTENIKNFVLSSRLRLMAGAIVVFGFLILNSLFIEGNDSLGFRFSGLALMALLLYLSKSNWVRQAYKYELSCIITSVSLRASALIKFSKLVLLAASTFVSEFSERVRLRVLYHVSLKVVAATKTIFTSYLAAKARIKSALRAIALTLTPKLLQIPVALRA